jgi:hypothetical protein
MHVAVSDQVVGVRITERPCAPVAFGAEASRAQPPHSFDLLYGAAPALRRASAPGVGLAAKFVELAAPGQRGALAHACL